MAIFSLAPLARMTRGSMLAVLGSDFIRTARASGLPPRTVVFTYAFRNALLPVDHHARHGVLVPARRQRAGRDRSSPGRASASTPSNALIASDYAPVQGFVLIMAMLYVAAQPR